jgi:gamma-D-glutamyl-L-lysine dipeptidyl-peptidase
MSLPYAYCKFALAPLRKEMSDTSEMVSQLLFGEVVEILDTKEQWLKVRSFIDNYEGWTDFKLLGNLTQKEAFRWIDGQTIEHQLTRKLKTENGNLLITAGSFCNFSLVQTFSIGKEIYSYLDEEIDKPTSIIDFAKTFLNAPYLWGGKSPFGMDCSGFTQTVFRLFDIKLPRDAYQQAEEGQTIEFGEHKAGDLAFFINQNGKIHHVGILINENEIIHAHGFVRIDDFTIEGITRKSDGIKSHVFHSIRRY